MHSRVPAGRNRLRCARPSECPFPHIKDAAASLQQRCMSVYPEQLPKSASNCGSACLMAERPLRQVSGRLQPRVFSAVQLRGKHVHMLEDRFLPKLVLELQCTAQPGASRE